MKDSFFTQKHCSRCGKELRGGRIMSMYNTQCICMDCADDERKKADYKEARDAEATEVKKGNYNYKGIRG